MNKPFAKKHSYETDCLLLLSACFVPSVLFNGLGGVKIIVAGVITAVLTDALGTLLLNGNAKVFNIYSVITGLSVSMLISGNAHVYVAVIASFFAVAVGKLPFGDWKKVPFVPAAVGAAAVWVLYPDECFSFPMPFSGTVNSSDALTAMLRNGISANMTTPGIMSIIVGNCPGHIGTTCSILLVAGIVYFVFRNLDSFFVASGFVGISALIAVLFPRVQSGVRASVIMELCGGALLFSAVFLMTYPNVKFRSMSAAFIYGALGGAVLMAIRHLGTLQDSAPFAVLIVNSLIPYFENRKSTSVGVISSSRTEEVSS